MSAKKYIVRLSQRAQILLHADVGSEGPCLKGADIVILLEVSCRTVERTRQRLIEVGLKQSLERKVRQRSRDPRLDGEQEAHLIALTCSGAPKGYHRWSLRLLAKTMVDLDHVDSVCPETIRQVKKKRHKTLAT